MCHEYTLTKAAINTKSTTKQFQIESRRELVIINFLAKHTPLSHVSYKNLTALSPTHGGRLTSSERLDFGKHDLDIMDFETNKDMLYYLGIV